MMIDYKRVVEAIIRLDITAHQFFVLYGIYVEDGESATKYINQLGGLSVDEILELREKGLADYLGSEGWFEEIYDTDSGEICRVYNNEIFQYQQFVVTPKFAEGIIIDRDVAGEEFWDAYPDMDSTKTYTWKTKVNANVMKQRYYEFINGDVEFHTNMIKWIEWAAKNNQIKCKIDDFLLGDDWKRIKKLFEESRGSGDLKSEEWL